MIQKAVATTVPENYVVRDPGVEDAPAVNDLINAHDLIFSGETESTVEEIIDDWKLPGFDLAQDAHIVLTRDGRAVGYETCWHRADTGRIHADGYVHPEFTGQGIGTYILRWAETRARDHIASYPDDVQIRVLVNCYAKDEAALAMFEAEGYHVTRHFWRMSIDFTEPPMAPEWPAGISVRTVVRGQDERAAHAAVTEAFRDHWGSVPMPFEEWAEMRIKKDTYDPSLWFLAIDDATGEVAGASLCAYRANNSAWVNTLGVRRPWRKTGLGMALLRHSFVEFYQRGSRRVELGVDAQNPTGATRLYERAGMEVAQRFASFEKELRPGRNLVPDEPSER